MSRMEIVPHVAENALVPPTTRWTHPEAAIAGPVTMFAMGQWVARKVATRRRRTHVDSPDKRAEWAHMLVLMGEVSAGRQAPDGAAFAAGTQATLNQLRQRPQVPRNSFLQR